MSNFLCLDTAVSTLIVNNDDEKFLRCLSSAIRLNLNITESMVACLKTIKTIEFPRITDFILNAEFSVYWLEPLMCLLQKFSKLKTLAVKTTGCPPCSWNQPSTIPQCISSHLEIVQWIEYEGKEAEKQLVKYILANSKCLKTVEMSFFATCHLKECQMELEAMPRISPSARLVYCTPKVCWSYKPDNYKNIY
ncbi:PREDICTED: putative F-box/FBD/LRR-repeat protein At1g22000 [Camelina sativa]|uniref:F-box/FBD/LRR-repeat protein At1g22000 n=1 Tax=Camelina sativa TaxID=90675 RepID=A0ABM0Z192_CAMSA|nr:PREDICTED: putative F-box/FBD/LRR-repeat protein At1g22000 [Camelina sativa]